MACLTLLVLASNGAGDSSGVSCGKVKLELYDVARWVDGAVVEFPSAGAISISKPPGETLESPEKFAARIKKAVAPGQWDESRGWEVRCQNGLLIVRAPLCVHRAIADNLQRLETTQR